MPQTIDEVVGEKQEFWRILETEESPTLSAAVLLLEARNRRQVQC